MALDLLHYVGPLGALWPLPDVASAIDTPLTVIGGTHVSLTGSVTRDRFGFKRSWTWTYPALGLHQNQFVEALQRGLVPGPLYLIDPRRINRLPEQQASGGSLLGSPDGFIPSNTAVCYWRPLSYVTAADVSTLPAAPLLSGCLEWATLTSDPATLELAGYADDGRLDIPVMPSEPLTVSGWVTGPVGSAVTVTASVYSAAGMVLSTATSAPTNLSLTAWASFSVDLTTDPTAASVRLSLARNGAPPASAFLTALQVARSDDPESVARLTDSCDFGDLTGGWRLGGGAPQVIADGGAASYTVPGLSSNALTLIER